MCRSPKLRLLARFGGPRAPLGRTQSRSYPTGRVYQPYWKSQPSWRIAQISVLIARPRTSSCRGSHTHRDPDQLTGRKGPVRGVFRDPISVRENQAYRGGANLPGLPRWKKIYYIPTLLLAAVVPPGSYEEDNPAPPPPQRTTPAHENPGCTQTGSALSNTKRGACRS